MATPTKYQIQVQKAEVADPHVGLVFQVTADPNGPFLAGTYSTGIAVAISEESSVDPVSNPPNITLPLPDGMSTEVFVVPFTDSRYGAGRTAYVSVNVNGVSLNMPNNGQTTTETDFSDPRFRYWIPGGNNADPNWQNKLASILNPGDYLISPSQRYKTVLEVGRDQSARIVTYDMLANPHSVVWNTATFNPLAGKGPFFAVMVQDGNFCLYQGSYQSVYPTGYTWRWGSWQSSGQTYPLSGGPVFLQLGDDGHLRIYNGSSPDTEGTLLYTM